MLRFIPSSKRINDLTESNQPKGDAAQKLQSAVIRCDVRSWSCLAARTAQPLTGMSGRTRCREPSEPRIGISAKRVQAEMLHRVESPRVAPGVAHGITNRYRRDAQRE